MLAALYVSGKLITGCNHGDAFGKLTECEKNQEIQSGFIDQENFKFIADDCEFYLKKIILIRHAEAHNNNITEKGYHQIKQISTLINNMHLIGYNGFCSPLHRCTETANTLENYCNINFSINKDLGEQTNNENDETFLSRIRNVLDNLPEKSLLISHCDFIKIMTQLTTGEELTTAIPNCSIILINNNKFAWLK